MSATDTNLSKEETIKKYKKLKQQYQFAQAEIDDLTTEFEEQREDLLDSLRETYKEIQLYKQIAYNVLSVPAMEEILYKSKCKYYCALPKVSLVFLCMFYIFSLCQNHHIFFLLSFFCEQGTKKHKIGNCHLF